MNARLECFNSPTAYHGFLLDPYFVDFAPMLEYYGLRNDTIRPVHCHDTVDMSFGQNLQVGSSQRRQKVFLWYAWHGVSSKEVRR